MKTIECNYALAQTGKSVLGTTAAPETSFGLSERSEDERNTLWQNVIDQLVEWGQTPGKIDEDELISPKLDAIESAYKLLCQLRDKGYPPPVRIVSDGEGGIVFERKAGHAAETFEIEADGSTEFFRYQNSQIVAHCKIPIEYLEFE